MDSQPARITGGHTREPIRVRWNRIPLTSESWPSAPQNVTGSWREARKLQRGLSVCLQYDCVLINRKLGQRHTEVRGVETQGGDGHPQAKKGPGPHRPQKEPMPGTG